MKGKNKKSALKEFVLTTVILLAVALGWNYILFLASPITGAVNITGENGVWDLRGLLIDNDSFTLSGHVEYIPNALLNPEEFNKREKEAVYGYPQDVSQYATSRMRILVPDDGYYSFYRRSIDYSHRVYANGQLVTEIGSPGETKETDIPGSSTVFLTLKAQDGVIEIVQQASNFVHRDGGSHANWYIGTRRLGTILAYDFMDSIKLGSFLALFFVHVLFFLLLREYKGNLYFALFCLTWFLRSGFTGTKIFTHIFPWIPWQLMFRIEYLALPVTAVLLVSILDILFPLILHKWFCRAIYGASALIAVLFIFADTLFMSYALLACEAVYVLAIVYIIVRFVMRMRSPSAEQIIFLLGIFVFFLTAVIDMFFYSSLIPVYLPFLRVNDLTEITMLLLTYCQTIALFIVTLRQMETAAAENASLKEHARMMEQQIAMHRMHYEDIIEMVYREKKTDETICENQAVNAVALYYVDIAEKEGITVEAKLEIPQDTGSVPAMDICIIVGGLFENALKTCRRIYSAASGIKQDKYIRISSFVRAKSFNIEAANTIDNEKIKTDKKAAAVNGAFSSEGMWLSSVRAICAKHRGKVEKKTKGNLCTVTAQVHTEPDGKDSLPVTTSYENTFREYGLSKRESEVANLMVKGLNAEEIGENLFISESTVRIHMWRIYSKFGVTSRSEFMTLFVN